MRDSEAPGLRVRITSAGAKSFVFESKLNRQTIRRTIGDVKVWSIEQARTEARRLAVLLDNGQDPREIQRQQQAAKAAERAAASAKALTVGEVWPLYLESGKPKRRDAWKPRYRADLEAMAAPGGEPKKRGQGVTRQGPLYPLLALPLSGVNEDTLKIWYDREAVAGKHQAARALMMFRGFLRWCSARPEYRSLIDRDAGKAAAIVENLPSNTRRTGGGAPQPHGRRRGHLHRGAADFGGGGVFQQRRPADGRHRGLGIFAALRHGHRIWQDFLCAQPAVLLAGAAQAGARFHH